MKRFTANNLRNSFELGTTSNWVVAFEEAGSKAPPISNFNLIKTPTGGLTPVLDISFDEETIETESFTYGCGIKVDIPVFSQPPTQIKLTCFDSDLKTIKDAMLLWVRKYLKINKGLAPSLNRLKDSSLLLVVYNFDTELNSLDRKNAYYVIPKGALEYRGDQSFSLDSFPIEFTILGTQ